MRTDTVARVRNRQAEPKPAAPPMTTAARPDFKPLQPAATFTGAPIPPLQTGLPKFTRSLCPECKGAVTLEARLFEEDGKVWM